MKRGTKHNALIAAIGLSVMAWPGAAHAQSIEELRDMSITDLANFDVSSVTKSAGTLGEAPAAIYVITHDDIVRSGNITLPGMLRLAPNLQVMRGGNGGLIVTARGLSGNAAAQSFSNKLLVLIDGRSVYSPLYSGVYWDMQDLLPEDIDRIEVISGPGATLWGANAVNGVINIITRPAGATQGIYATAVAGNRTRDLGLRYGGRVGDTINYRLYAKGHRNRDTGDTVNNDSWRVQGGFQVDWTPSDTDRLMVQGDAYRGSRGQTLAAREVIHGRDLLARWNRDGAASSLQVQAYYDRTGRKTRAGGGRYVLDTGDIDIQHSFALGTAHNIVWGGGARINRYEIDGPPNFFFVPPKRTLFLANIFVQDSVALTPQLTAVAGLKLEKDPYSGVAVLPSARLSWKPDASLLLWAAASRAIRSPTPFDRDVVERAGGADFLIGPSTFRSEKLTAYEAGTRLIASSQASLSISAFYNVYDDLRSIEPAPGGFLPVQWGNGIKGHSYGFDSWADLRVTDWWRIKPGYSLLIQRFRFKPSSAGLLFIEQVGNDPKHRVTLRSSMDIGPRLNLDADLRYVSSLPNPRVSGYIELGARVGYLLSQQAELSVSGFNLLHKRHLELPATEASPVPRSVFVALKWHL
ncbi:TonB-dependent receptor [Sphingomonas sp. Root710]|uniref:TonB-dependent receptor plug domain-containing protein n=1 Tax=Sphingomonas sp. Root710 TaxID=1736594 RepID=UPI0006F4BB41|nr:TonB-dependent receptor [Sphingomonas sp. Root710]KRB79731.1 TonB-dependent receptor [Sphingomonas sp. Root710]